MCFAHHPFLVLEVLYIISLIIFSKFSLFFMELLIDARTAEFHISCLMFFIFLLVMFWRDFYCLSLFDFFSQQFFTCESYLTFFFFPMLLNSEISAF